MKIALIGQKGLPTIYGGVERHVENLAVRLVELGHEVYAYTRHNYTDKNLKSYKGVHLLPLPNVPTKNLDAISHTFLATLDVIFRRKVDVIHFHSIGPSSLIWLVKLLKPRTPVFFTFHSQCYYNQKWGGFGKLYLKLGEYIGCTFADTIITVSKELFDYTKKKYPKANVCYIPNGVNTPKLLEAELIKSKWNLEKDSYILNVGRVVKNKGLEYLVEAYKNLKTDKKLVIVGSGVMDEELKELVGNHPNILLTGNQSEKTLEELYSNAYLFVQPSESEGLSLALLEAMSYKNAVLVSDIPANLEVVDANGISFKNKNAADLEAKLNELLANPEKVSRNKEAMFKRVSEAYNWSNLVDEIVEQYQKELKA